MRSKEWSSGGSEYATAIGLLLLEALYVYRSPALPEIETVLEQGISRLFWQDGVLKCALIAGNPSQPVVDLFACACSDAAVDVSGGLLDLERDVLLTGGQWIMVIAPPAWMLRTLITSYEFIDTVVFYEWQHQELAPLPSLVDEINLGAIRHEDIEAVQMMDAASFIPVWRASSKELARWLQESLYAFSLRSSNRVIAYLLAGQQGHSGHIYRIAVDPGWQGRGLGKWLMLYTMQKMLAAHVQVISLNTQASNHRSRKLYESIGFQLTDQAVSIYAHELTAG